MKFETYNTTRLFYNKYVYRITCYIKNPLILLGVKSSLSKEYTGSVKTRVENKTLNIYTNSKEILDTLSLKLKECIVKIAKPETSEYETFLLSSNGRKILCKKLPKNTFKYRIFLRTGIKSDTKSVLLSWSEKNSGKIQLSKTTKSWLKGERRWIQDAFLYVDDSKTLSMIGLIIPENVKKIEEFVIKD